MVKMINSEFIGIKRELIGACLLLCVSCFIFPGSAFSQQPQAPAGTPLYSANAKYVNGVAPGYWPTAGSGLTLNVSAGTAYCGNPPALVSYPGGTLTMTVSATNYVYLNPANNCAPAVSTSTFAAGQVPIAKVVAGTSSITSITDARTWFTPQPCSTSSSGAVDCSAAGTNQNIALTPTGTGASVITNFEDKGGQVFNVKAYGAVGNGTANDTTAIQVAVNAAVAANGGIVYLPPPTSCYLVDSTINLTKLSKGNLIIEGHAGGNSENPTLCANTGNSPVFDTTGSGGITLRNLNVSATVSGLSNPSEIGYLSGRDTSGYSGQENKIIDCTFQMPTHTSGTTISYGIYLYGVELMYDTRDYVTADYPLVVTASNILGLNSALVPWGTGVQSETQDAFTDMELVTAGLGPAAYFEGTKNMTLTGHSSNLSGKETYASSLYQYALEFTGINTAMFVNWRQELYPGFAYIQGSLLDSYFMGNDAPGPDPALHAIEFEDASSEIINNTFRIFDEYMASTTNYYYDSTAGSTQGVAVLDHNNFSCGSQTNCIDIPVGNYQPGGWALYSADNTWSGDAQNPAPSVIIGGDNARVAGTINVPATTVGANSCVGLPSVTNADITVKSIIEFSNTQFWGTMLSVAPGPGSFTAYLCNPSTSDITTGAGTEYWRLVQ